jgi:hypothetical protein
VAVHGARDGLLAYPMWKLDAGDAGHGGVVDGNTREVCGCRDGVGDRSERAEALGASRCETSREGVVGFSAVGDLDIDMSQTSGLRHDVEFRGGRGCAGAHENLAEWSVAMRVLFGAQARAAKSRGRSTDPSRPLVLVSPVDVHCTKRRMSFGPPVLAPGPTDECFQPPNGWRCTIAPVVWRFTYALPTSTCSVQ